MQSYGYVRISSTSQNEARQLQALGKVGIPKKNIFVDKCSGADFARPQYVRLLKHLKPNDTLYIVDVDRLGRNYLEIKEQWSYLVQKKEINIVVLNMPILNTTEIKDLMTNFISDLVLQILSFAAQKERESIKERQAQGIAIAKAKGVRFGRPRKSLPEAFAQNCKLYHQGKLTARQAAQACGMPLSTFYVKAREHSY